MEFFFFKSQSKKDLSKQSLEDKDKARSLKADSSGLQMVKGWERKDSKNTHLRVKGGASHIL